MSKCGVFNTKWSISQDSVRIQSGKWKSIWKLKQREYSKLQRREKVLEKGFLPLVWEGVQCGGF